MSKLGLEVIESKMRIFIYSERLLYIELYYGNFKNLKGELEMNRKLLKVAPLAMLLVLLISTAPIYAANYGDNPKLGTHIDDVKGIYAVEQGDTLTIKAQLWRDHQDFYWDLPYKGQKLTVSIKDLSGNIVAQKTVKTKLMGKAEIKFDTANLTPGQYKIDVDFAGSNSRKSSFVRSNLVIIGK